MKDNVITKESFGFLETATDREIEVGNKQFLFFGGTAYLGLNRNPEFIDLYLEGIRKYGLNNGTSRSNNVQLAVYRDAEEFAAAYFGAEAALVVSSGFLASQLVIKYFSSVGEVIYAPESHPALWLGVKPVVSSSFMNWISETVEYINQSKQAKFVLVSNAFDNLKPEYYDFSPLEKVHLDKEVILIIDDSHGLGVMGENGKGSLSSMPVQSNIAPIVVASLAKGLGVDGGLVLASKNTIRELKQNSMFLGASPPAPAAMYAFSRADEIFRNECKKLQINCRFFEEKLPAKFTSIKGLPVYYAGEEGLARSLFKENIIISSFPYPQKTDPILNRIVISSVHTSDDISKLVNVLAGCLPLERGTA